IPVVTVRVLMNDEAFITPEHMDLVPGQVRHLAESCVELEWCGTTRQDHIEHSAFPHGGQEFQAKHAGSTGRQVGGEGDFGHLVGLCDGESERAHGWLQVARSCTTSAVSA